MSRDATSIIGNTQHRILLCSSGGHIVPAIFHDCATEMRSSISSLVRWRTQQTGWAAACTRQRSGIDKEEVKLDASPLQQFQSRAIYPLNVTYIRAFSYRSYCKQLPKSSTPGRNETIILYDTSNLSRKKIYTNTIHHVGLHSCISWWHVVSKCVLSRHVMVSFRSKMCPPHKVCPISQASRRLIFSCHSYMIFLYIPFLELTCCFPETASGRFSCKSSKTDIGYQFQSHLNTLI